MPHQLIISRLLASKIEIFLPLSDSSIFYIKKDRFLDLLLPCKSLLSASDREHTPIARVNRTKISLAILDQFTETVRLLPEGFCSTQVNLRLGEKLEEFILPEPSSKSFQEQREERTGRLSKLKAQAKSMIRNQNQEQNPMYDRNIQ